jgi:hypothetical protein
VPGDDALLFVADSDPDLAEIEESSLASAPPL